MAPLPWGSGSGRRRGVTGCPFRGAGPDVVSVVSGEWPGSGTGDRLPVLPGEGGGFELAAVAGQLAGGRGVSRARRLGGYRVGGHRGFLYRAWSRRDMGS